MLQGNKTKKGRDKKRRVKSEGKWEMEDEILIRHLEGAKWKEGREKGRKIIRGEKKKIM